MLSIRYENVFVRIKQLRIIETKKAAHTHTHAFIFTYLTVFQIFHHWLIYFRFVLEVRVYLCLCVLCVCVECHVYHCWLVELCEAL